MDNNLIKNADIQRIAKEGTKIYDDVKSDYDPKEHGKFMAIEIGSKSVYLAKTSAEALGNLPAKNTQTKFFMW